MIYWLETSYRTVGRWFSRSKWLLHFLGNHQTTATTTEPGLVIIQIDGLSYSQLKKAMADGRMPFLQKLLQREHYQLHHLYSGLPSTTPAVQGELFYGIKTSVPAFCFNSKALGKVVRMYEQPAASLTEKQLAMNGIPLLKGGSSYSNNFIAGAEEASFCPSSFGWAPLFGKANPVATFLMVIIYLFSFIRVGALLFIEIILAIIDFFRGIIDGRDLAKELMFVPARVAICILLRELITIGVKLDLAKGRPIIHLNLLGYDEQAHRRGPKSKFAHWSLKGIDDAIDRIWRDAKASKKHDYDIWIYSDHGQEETLPYKKKFGISVVDAIKNSVKETMGESLNITSGNDIFGIQSQRVTLFGRTKLQKILRSYQKDEPKTAQVADVGRQLRKQAIHLGEQNHSKDIVVTAMGPLGYIYFPDSVSKKKIRTIAPVLIKKAGIPMVLIADVANKVQVWTDQGTFQLTENAESVFGSEHPFLNELTDDMLRLCHHPDAGDLVLCGWHPAKPYLTFVTENGSHGGPGTEETHAFAILPKDTVLPKRQTNYLRPNSLYSAAMHHLKRQEIPLVKTEKTAKANRAPRHLRVMTYNVHSCIGMDGKLSPHRIARVIAQYRPDVVALQELDVGKERSGNVDQAHAISEYLQMTFHFQPAIHVEEEQYGNAILSHLPLKLVKAGNYPLLPDRPHLEPRGVIWVEITLNNKKVQVINTHLGLSFSERKKQVSTLLGDKWLSKAKSLGPVVLCGDFNAFPNSAVHKKISEVFNDAQTVCLNKPTKNTFFGRFPTVRIDHIFIDSSTKALSVNVPRTHQTRNASDHLPLIVDLKV